MTTTPECFCGEPPIAECHQPGSAGGCECRPDRHTFGCHYLPWVMMRDAKFDSVEADRRDAESRWP